MDKLRIDLSSKSLPKVTGNGPFIETPKFEPLGSTGAVLNVQLPQASELKIRTTAIMALNGDLSKIETRLSHSKSGLWYQSVRLKSPVSLLLSGDNLNHHILNTNLNENWVFEDLKSVSAWSGDGLRITRGFDEDRRRNLLHCKGRGSLVVTTARKVFEIEVPQGELLLVSPSAVVASNVPLVKSQRLLPISTFGTLLSRPSWFELFPQLPTRLTGMIKHYFGQFVTNMKNQLQSKVFIEKKSTRTTNIVTRSLFSLWYWMKSIFSFHRSLFYVATGPCKMLIVDNPELPLRGTFGRH